MDSLAEAGEDRGNEAEDVAAGKAGETPQDVDLAAVVKAWPNLPEAAKADVLAVVSAHFQNS